MPKTTADPFSAPWRIADILGSLKRKIRNGVAASEAIVSIGEAERNEGTSQHTDGLIYVANQAVQELFEASQELTNLLCELAEIYPELASEFLRFGLVKENEELVTA